MSDRGQPSGWRRFVPISFWLTSYEKGFLVPDLVAALTVWALVVPEAMAYASLAGMPPETGLYAALVAPLAYAIFGTSRQLNVGPSSTVAVLSASIIAPLAASGDPELFVELTTALAILTGAFFVVAGLVKLGFLADFMSKPVLDGFIVGLALTIAAGQLHKLFGIEATGDNFFGDIVAVVSNLDETVIATLVIGAGSLVLLFVMEHFVPRIPAALVVAAVAIVIVSILRPENVAIIGEIPGGLPSLGWPTISGGQWIELIPGAIAIVIVGFAESVAAARTYARKYGYAVDADQEMVALGAANAATGMVGAFVVDGSLSKTAAADQAGQKTQLASIGLTAAVFVTILFLTGLFENLPEATLGAIVIHAVWHLIDFDKIGRYWTLRRDDFWAGAAALLGVLVFDILVGLLVAVAVSFLLILARASRPRWAVLGRTHHEEADDFAFHSLEAHPDAETFPGLLIFRFDADLFFANANAFADDVREAIAASEPLPRVVLLDAESIADIDSTAVGVLRDLIVEFRDDGIEFWAARVKTRVAEMMSRLGVDTDSRVYPTVGAAVAAFELLGAPDDGDASSTASTASSEGQAPPEG
ncbi:MAG: sulfate permease [Chloroflexota bacterium]|jgi:high affinity sulfate transporter 1